MIAETRWYVVGLEDGKRVYEPRNAKYAAVEAGKDKE